MRIIAGTARSLPLRSIEGRDTRPTTDRIKETLFNILQTGIEGCSFLDLFAGSGQIGLEALSRGANHAVFVENSKKACACIEENIRFTRFDARAKLLSMEASGALRTLEGNDSFDYIFMDPPYQSGMEQEVLIYLAGSGLLKEDGVIIIEAAADTDFSYVSGMGLKVIREKKYKTNKHIFVTKGGVCMVKAIYPGSFDPVTKGHLDVIERSSRLVDELVVGVLNNSAKNALFSVLERVTMLKELTAHFPNVTVDAFDGLLVDYAKRIGAVIIVRGLRAVTDFEYELQIAQTNHEIDTDIETIFLTTRLEYAYLSSTIVKEVASYGGDISHFVPHQMIARIYAKYGIKGFDQ